MPKYVDEHIRARELYVQFGYSFAQIVREVPVSIDTVRRWAKDESWSLQREEVITDPLGIALRIKRILSHLVEEIELKIANKEFVAPTEVKKMLDYSKAIGFLDGERDRKSSALFAMQSFTAWLYDRGEAELIKHLHVVLPEYYRSLVGHE